MCVCVRSDYGFVLLTKVCHPERPIPHNSRKEVLNDKMRWCVHKEVGIEVHIISLSNYSEDQTVMPCRDHVTKSFKSYSNFCHMWIKTRKMIQLWGQTKIGNSYNI